MHMLTLLLAQAVVPHCPAGDELERVASGPPEVLSAALRACAALAQEQRLRIEAAHAVLSASMGTDGDAAAPPIPVRKRTQASSATQHWSLGTSLPPIPPRRTRPAGGSSSSGGSSGSSASSSVAVDASALATRVSSPRSELTTWHENVEDQLLAQRAQAERVRRHLGSGKRERLVRASALSEALSWSVACEPELYLMGRRMTPGCTPAYGPDGGRRCKRVLIDAVIDEREQQLLIASAERAMHGLFHQGAQT